MEPNDLASQFHDQMPVILHPDDYDRWMQGEEIPLVSTLAVDATIVESRTSRR